MNGTWEELFGLLEQVGRHMDRLAEIAQEKTAAVMRDDLMGVNECMKKEQAISLSLRSMDIKREKLLTELGLSSFPLSALPDRCPPEKRPEARRITEEVRVKYQLYRSAAEVSRTTLEVNLHQIEKVLADEDSGSGQDSRGGTMADFRA